MLVPIAHEIGTNTSRSLPVSLAVLLGPAFGSVVINSRSDWLQY